MRHSKILLLFSVTLVLTLLAIVAPAMPVFGAMGTLTISPISGVVGTPVSVTGTGFTANSSFTLTYESVSVASGNVSATGTISTSFNLPASIRGAHTLTFVSGVGDTLSAPVVFTVTSDVILTPNSGYGGEQLSISGTGFAASATVNITFDGTTIGTATTGTNGSFSSIIVTTPQTYRGAHTVIATDGLGTSPSYTFTISSKITLTPPSAAIGAPLTITGAGFSASSPVTFYIDNVALSTATATTTTATGSFTLSNFIVPAVSYGDHVLKAMDSGGGSATATFSTTQSMSITPQAGGVGTVVQVTGKGFRSNANIVINFGGTDVQTTPPSVTSDASGNFSASFAVPASSSGVNVVTANDGTVSSSANFSVVSMDINPQQGAPGTSVQITGQGFGANKKINITFKGATAQTNPPSITSDASGNFSATFIVPAAGGGNNQVVANDGTASSTKDFKVLTTVKVTGDKGPVGTSITVSGSGVVPGVNVVIKWNTAQLTQVAAGTNGDFSANTKVPPSKAGAHTITVTDGTTTKTFPFTVVASASLAQTSGNVGTDITASGTGFNSGATVNISYDGAKIATATVDADGNFTASFKAPASKGGNHTIIATDGTNSITSTFTMETAPPPAPALNKPPDDTKGEQLQDFIWSGVTDPSGVTYVFQLATDSNFNAIVLEKKDLTNAGLKITELERLKSRSQKEPYFWRVKAIDGASNESGWSSTFSFYVGFVMPQWGWYTIYGVGGLILFLLGFFLGRSSSGY